MSNGEKIVSYMKEHNCKASEAAAKLGVSVNSYYAYQHGLRKRASKGLPAVKKDKPQMISLAVPADPQTVTIVSCHVSLVSKVMAQLGG